MDDLDEFDNFLIDLRDRDDSIRAESRDFVPTILEPQMSRIGPLITQGMESVIRNYRLFEAEEISPNLEDNTYPPILQSIKSMVGDDEVNTTNSLVYAVLCIIVGPVFSRIKISWDDVQFNKRLFNYAEGWIFLPPSRDSSFESVTRHNRGNGVPFVLDGVKFKDLSAVRKQSAMNVDLASKFKNLSQRATWTNQSWPTWNSHQFALILGLEIFDFMRSKIYPFLFGWEGGCGGAPPWHNLYTAAAACFRFRGGRAKVGIMGIMSDSNRLQQGTLKPEDAFFTKNLNLAMSGDKRWLSIRNELEHEKHEAHLAGLDFNTEVTAEADKTIPPELEIGRAHV